MKDRQLEPATVVTWLVAAFIMGYLLGVLT